MENPISAELIFVSLEQWDEIWRRNQFLCSALLKRDEDTRILFVEPPRDLSNAIRTRRWELMRPADRVPAEFQGRLRRFRPLKLFPNSLSWGRRLNERLARRQIAAEAKKMGFAQPVLWINAHYAGHLTGHLEESLVVYDITDDWTEIEQGAQEAALTRQQDAALCRAADAVIVCSPRLLDLKKAIADRIYLIPNGVDSEHYCCVLDGFGGLPEETSRWARPVFGYTGTVHPDRLDVDLVEDIARRLTRGSIVLIGPSHLSADQTARLQAFGNVHLPGPVPYARIPQYMRAFDACIVPHRVTAFTESLNPIKLWEYLAAGKPIVSTDVAGFRDHAEVLAIAGTTEEFFQAMEAALTEAPGVGEARRALARPHSWEARLDEVKAVLYRCLEDEAQQRSV